RPHARHRHHAPSGGGRRPARRRGQHRRHPLCPWPGCRPAVRLPERRGATRARPPGRRGRRRDRARPAGLATGRAGAAPRGETTPGMNVLPVALWGGMVGLDAASFPQVMISRPLVAATVTGLLAGRPADGLLLGVILEAFALLILPVGAARYPESGTGAVAAAGAYLAAAPPELDAAPLLSAVVFC